MQGMSFAFQQNRDQLLITVLSYSMKSKILRKTCKMRYKPPPPHPTPISHSEIQNYQRSVWIVMSKDSRNPGEPATFFRNQVPVAQVTDGEKAI